MNSDATTFTQLLVRYERVIEISQQLNATRDHVALLRRIISAAMELLDIEAASILLVDPSTGELRFELAANMDDDVTQEPNFFKNVDDVLEFKTRNVLAVPLRTHQKVIGALEAVNKRSRMRF